MKFISHGFHNHLNNHRNKTKPVNQKAYSSCRLFYCIDVDKGMCKTEKRENIEVKRGILVFVRTQGSKEQSNDKKRVNIFHIIHVSASYSFNIIVRFQRLLKNQNEKILWFQNCHEYFLSKPFNTLAQFLAKKKLTLRSY